MDLVTRVFGSSPSPQTPPSPSSAAQTKDDDDDFCLVDAPKEDAQHHEFSITNTKHLVDALAREKLVEAPVKEEAPTQKEKAEPLSARSIDASPTITPTSPVRAPSPAPLLSGLLGAVFDKFAYPFRDPPRFSS